VEGADHLGWQSGVAAKIGVIMGILFWGRGVAKSQSTQDTDNPYYTTAFRVGY